MLHSARIPAHHTPAILRTHGERGGWSHSKEEGKMAFLLTMKSKIKNKEAPGYHFFFKAILGASLFFIKHSMLIEDNVY